MSAGSPSTVKMMLDLTATLSGSPVERVAQIMTAAAIVALTCGMDDDDAVHMLRVALAELREHGLGEGLH